jgi:ribosome-associated heat shock protein Hsp15
MSHQVPQDCSVAPVARLRIDKWLWSARFFKTRALAKEAVEAGRVRLLSLDREGERLKPGREIRPGQRLRIQIGDTIWIVDVLGLSEQRLSAPLARKLYDETAEGQAARLALLAERKAWMEPGSEIRGRPTKKDRRLIHRFTD